MERSYCSNSNVGGINNSSVISNSNVNGYVNVNGDRTNVDNRTNGNYTNSLNSYINGVKESYNSLDRSCSGVEVSRSKSRRKRIF